MDNKSKLKVGMVIEPACLGDAIAFITPTPTGCVACIFFDEKSENWKVKTAKCNIHSSSSVICYLDRCPEAGSRIQLESISKNSVRGKVI